MVGNTDPTFLGLVFRVVEPNNRAEAMGRQLEHQANHPLLKWWFDQRIQRSICQSANMSAYKILMG